MCRAGAHSRNRPSLTHGTCCSLFCFALLHQSFGVEGNEQFFVCCNDDSLRRAILRDEVVGFLAALEVAFFVNLVAEELEVVQSLLADVEAVFADAAREHDGVDARESHGEATDFTSEAVAEDIESDLSLLVAFACSLRQSAHVIAEARETE